MMGGCSMIKIIKETGDMIEIESDKGLVMMGIITADKLVINRSELDLVGELPKERSEKRLE